MRNEFSHTILHKQNVFDKPKESPKEPSKEPSKEPAKEAVKPDLRPKTPESFFP